ncbi:MAG: protoporphyrinogen oxidase [Dermatophilaceae bacterium]
MPTHGAPPDADGSRATPHVVVVGGGLTGMTAARRLAQGGARVTLVEAADRLGGHVLTLDVPRAGAPIDVGAEAMYTGAPETEALLDELGLREDMVLARAGESWLWTPAGRRRLPPGVGPAGPTRLRPVLRSGVMTVPGLARAGLEPIAARLRGRRPVGPGQDISVGDFVAGRFGRQVVDRFVDPLLGGLHSGDVRQLSLRATTPSLVGAASSGRSLMPLRLRDLPSRALRGSLPRRRGAGRHAAPPGSARPADGARPARHARPASPVGMRFLSWPGGLRTVLDALLADVDVDVRIGTLVTSLTGSTADGPRGGDAPGSSGTWRPSYRLQLQAGVHSELVDADAVVLAVPAWAAQRLLAPLLPRVSDTLAATRVASTATVVLGFPREDVAGVAAFAGNGLLIGSGTGTLLKAVTNLSAKWPQYADDELFWVRLSAGRDGADRVTPLTDEHLVDHLRRDLRALTGLDAAPVVVHVQRWRRGLPQLTVGHVDRVNIVRAELAGALPGLALAGASYDGIGLAACLGSARGAAALVLDALGLPSPGLATPQPTGRPTPRTGSASTTPSQEH